ncbi:cell envelope integrity protein TolA [Candidatus Regiella endosymbiont of Tuberolachnus salignus]|uniref:cell envelope integrity protein TolA n=1 Tax=Candidatus Regiella endosymbiont of Tuberolachnus salignus TaxID=3077956 RepID=UPI0030D4F093
MAKTTQQSDKLNLAVIISVILHIILIACFIWGYRLQHADMAGTNASAGVMDAVMVDTSATAPPDRRQNTPSTDAKNKKKTELQAEELQQKKIAERQRQQDLEDERRRTQQNAAKMAEEQQKKLAEQQKQLAIQQKLATEAIEKAKIEQKKAEATAAQAKAEADKVLKAAAAREKAAEAKKEADSAAKKQAAAKKMENDTKQKAVAEAAKRKLETDSAKAVEVDNLLDDLASSKNTPNQGEKVATNESGVKKSGASGADINGYLGQITAAIQSRFYDADLYKGRTCDLRIKLAPEGGLISVVAEGGDSALCQAAIAAAKQAKIPKPPSDDVYQVFKNASLVFKPQ